MQSSDQKALRFFCNAYDELEELCNNPLSDYKINQVSRILRQFLFDDKSVISTAARLSSTKERRFSFICNPYVPQTIAHIDFRSIQDGFYPEPDMPFATPIKVSRQNLGKQLLFEYNGVAYTVRQLVKYIANKEGGVHFDQTELDISEKEMCEVQDYLNVGGRAALTSMLKGVGLVVLDGLVVLRKNAELTLVKN